MTKWSNHIWHFNSQPCHHSGGPFCFLRTVIYSSVQERMHCSDVHWLVDSSGPTFLLLRHSASLTITLLLKAFIFSVLLKGVPSCQTYSVEILFKKKIAIGKHGPILSEIAHNCLQIYRNQSWESLIYNTYWSWTLLKLVFYHWHLPCATEINRTF